VGLAGAALAFNGLHWLLTACWPGRLRIVADVDGITFHVGPMGIHHYAMDRLRVRYPFELNQEDDGDAIYESLLQPSEQLATLLPRIEYDGQPIRIDRRILHFTSLDERQAADVLRPFLVFARS